MIVISTVLVEAKESRALPMAVGCAARVAAAVSAVTGWTPGCLSM
jgi:hypothetical protein